MKISYILIPLLFLSILSCNPRNNRITVEQWSILYEQTKSPDSAIKNSKWQQIQLPAMIKVPYDPVQDYQFVWFKSEFNIDNDPSSYFGIIPGVIYHADTVYINNQFIGEHSKDELHNIYFPRHYQIPQGVLVKGANSVLIRVGIYGREYGGIPDEVQILARGDFLRSKILNDLIYRQVPIGIVILLLGQVIFHLLFFIWRKADPVNIYSAIICLSWIAYILMLFSPYQPLSVDFRITFLWSCISFVPIFFTLFVQAYYQVYLSFFNRIMIPVLIIITLIIILFQDTTSQYYPGRVLGVFTLISFCPLLFILFYQINKVKKDKVIFIFLIFGVFPGCFIIWDVINYLWIFHTPPLSHTYTLPIFIIGIMILIIHKSIRAEIKLELLYSKLKKNNTDKKAVLTATSEQKLDQVISFIKENYTSDISREGLANAIGMSTDHMSRSFKAFYGKRINDYINELRIMDASEQLRKTDNKIADIAFSVGFESITTFNRAFLKVLNVTPSDYKHKAKD